MKIADGGLLKNKDGCHEALILYVIMNLSIVIDTLASLFFRTYIYCIFFFISFTVWYSITVAS